MSIKIFTVGLNAARIYMLDANGLPAAADENPYDGLSIGGPVTFSYDAPSDESIVHPGNNRVLQRDSFPSLETSSATLEVSRTDYESIAALTNTKVNPHATDISSIVWQSDQQGNSPSVALVLYAQAKNKLGARRWSTYVFAQCNISPKPKGMSREQQNHTYFVQPQIFRNHLTGVAMTINNDGATQGEIVEYQSIYRLHFAAWKVTSVEDEFSFVAELPYADVGADGITVTKNGVLMTYASTPSGATQYKATDKKITFGAALTNGDIVVAMYELANSAIDED